MTGKRYAGENYAPRTRRHARAVVRSFYEYHRDMHGRPLLNPFPKAKRAEDEHLNAHHNPMHAYRHPTRRAPYQPKEPRRSPRGIPDQAFNELFAALPSHRDRALVAFYISAGPRASELLGVSRDRVSPGDQTIGVIRKGSRALQWIPASKERAFWAWAIVEVLRHTGMRIEEALELTHHSFVAYQLPTTGEIVPMLQVAPSKLDQERLLLVSPELSEVLTAIIHRVRRGQQAMPLVAAYDSLERLWSAPMPFLFQRRCGPEDRAIPRNYIYTCLNDALSASGLTGPANEQLRYTPHDFRRIFVTDALRSGLPPHIAARICGHRTVDTTLGYAAIYPEDVINHHRSFIARRRTLRPSEEYREPTAQEWQDFLAHFELRKVALGVCARDFGTPCVHEHACIRCPVLRPDPEQRPRLEEIHANLLDRLQEAKEQGWLGEVTAIEASLAAAEQKLAAMRDLAARHTTVHLGMPDFRTSAGRLTGSSDSG
ncbi:site-specific tyrosine recombinase XerC [Streptomyces sp. ADI92-24]|nr:site-specific tyrosine recombinase XerC [Streptomyces sp. ADI92-24]